MMAVDTVAASHDVRRRATLVLAAPAASIVWGRPSRLAELKGGMGRAVGEFRLSADARQVCLNLPDVN